MNYFELEPVVFKEQLSKDQQSLLVDVREEYEFEDENIGGINIPMGDVLSRINDLKEQTSVYICCKSGNRSKAIAYHLSQHIPECTIYALKGGIVAYKESNV